MRLLQTELIEKGFSQARTRERVKSSKTRGKTKEQLTDGELRELMGVHRQTHKRVNGAVRKR